MANYFAAYIMSHLMCIFPLLCVLEQHKSVSRAELERLISEVLRAYDKGVVMSTNSTGNVNWDFSGALFFCTGLIAAIGG